MNYWEKKSEYKSLDYRSINFTGNWSKHFINYYVDSLISNGVEATQETFANYKNEHLPDNLYKFFPPTLYSLINIQFSQFIFLPQEILMTHLILCLYRNRFFCEAFSLERT